MARWYILTHVWTHDWFYMTQGWVTYLVISHSPLILFTIPKDNPKQREYNRPRNRPSNHQHLIKEGTRGLYYSIRGTFLVGILRVTHPIHHCLRVAIVQSDSGVRKNYNRLTEPIIQFFVLCLPWRNVFVPLHTSVLENGEIVLPRVTIPSCSRLRVFKTTPL